MPDYLKKSAPKNPIWLSVSEAAKLGGVNGKTIRRALKTDNGLKFKITSNRYQIELGSLTEYLQTNTKLKNKFFEYGLGQYWTKETKSTKTKST